MSKRPKTCSTCARREGFPTWRVCNLSGYFTSTERKYPTICGVDYKGWVQKEPILLRFKRWLYLED